MSRRQFREVMSRVTQLSQRRRLTRTADLQTRLYASGEVPSAPDSLESRGDLGKPKGPAEKQQRSALNSWENEGGATQVRVAKSHQGLN
jgi:hypothetical protein